jgi:hypothetical protein
MFAFKPGGQFVRSAIGPSISAVHPRPAQPSPLSQRCKHEKAAQCSASRYCQKAPQGGNAGPRAFWISASGGSRFCARLMPPICQGDAGRARGQRCRSRRSKRAERGLDLVCNRMAGRVLSVALRFRHAVWPNCCLGADRTTRSVSEIAFGPHAMRPTGL